MSEKPISPLRRRMLEDIAVRRFGENAQSNHIRQIETFTLFLGRSPDTATAEDVLHLTETGVRPSSINQVATSLRFFFGVTLARHLARVHYPRKLPRVLSPEEAGRRRGRGRGIVSSTRQDGANPLNPLSTVSVKKGCDVVARF